MEVAALTVAGLAVTGARREGSSSGRAGRARLAALAGLALAGLALAGTAAGSSAAGPPVGSQDSPDLRSLVARVERERDCVPSRIFDEIAAVGGAEALEALRRAIRSLRGEASLDAAYEAFRAFGFDPDLSRGSLDHLLEVALGHPRIAHRRSAARGLSAFGRDAHPHLLALVDGTRRSDVIELAIGPVVGLLAERGTAADARLLVHHGPVLLPSERRRLQRALLQFEGEAYGAVLEAVIVDERASSERRIALLEVFLARPTRSPHSLLTRLLRSRDCRVRTRALERIRGTTVRGLVGRLRRSLDSHHEPEVRAAVLALGSLARRDVACHRELLALARERRVDFATCLPRALALDGSEAALEALCALVAEDDGDLGAAAGEAILSTRPKGAIPLLIARLDAEPSSEATEVAAVLRLLTGFDHGQTNRRWMRWWSAEGGAFTPPDEEVALAQELARRERAAANPTQARGFYGIAVVDDRVAFVIDESGSMDTPADEPGRTRAAGSPGPTRLDVAKQQLRGAIGDLLPSARFNVLFFDSGVTAWRQSLAPKSASSSRDALRFVAARGADGGTNLHDALVEALGDTRVEAVYLLSDGDPTAGPFTEAADILRSVRDANRRRKARIHCISIGQDSALLRSLAREHGGEYRRVG
ncbi:MAG: VWA domain-containing protein [Planctomycetota bacterium]|jgi:hypothetical protein|nr:VWA domain-containing protein [Planctomycetota bacterium]MDP6764138.1 VWA domain-containing protein [Planctomycetota bacterium]MDP6988236.1 VWA domain-containing protein [Planctomycetota bacterium]